MYLNTFPYGIRSFSPLHLQGEGDREKQKLKGIMWTGLNLMYHQLQLTIKQHISKKNEKSKARGWWPI